MHMYIAPFPPPSNNNNNQPNIWTPGRNIKQCNEHSNLSHDTPFLLVDCYVYLFNIAGQIEAGSSTCSTCPTSKVWLFSCFERFTYDYLILLSYLRYTYTYMYMGLWSKLILVADKLRLFWYTCTSVKYDWFLFCSSDSWSTWLWENSILHNAECVSNSSKEFRRSWWRGCLYWYRICI